MGSRESVIRIDRVECQRRGKSLLIVAEIGQARAVKVACEGKCIEVEVFRKDKTVDEILFILPFEAKASGISSSYSNGYLEINVGNY